MSLINESMVECAFLETVKSPDGAGGYIISSWNKGKTFRAAITHDSSSEMKIAEAQGLKRIYTVTADKGVKLKYNDYFVRISDNSGFRVTSEQVDKETPEASTMSFAQVTAERCELPK